MGEVAVLMTLHAASQPASQAAEKGPTATADADSLADGRVRDVEKQNQSFVKQEGAPFTFLQCPTVCNTP